MKLFAITTKNTSTKNIKNFQAVAIQKGQLKALKGGTIGSDLVEW